MSAIDKARELILERSCRCGLQPGQTGPSPPARPPARREVRGAMSVNVCTSCGGFRP